MSEPMLTRRRLLELGGGASAAVLLGGAATGRAATAAPAEATIKVHGEQWGVSTRYIGADRGITNFDIADFKDLGMNTYRFYGGMGPWEYLDDDGVFGAPTIEHIKADAGVVNWAWWDEIFTNPPEGSPFWYATEPGVGWQGNSRKIFGDLRDAGVKPVVSLRVQNAQIKPDWAARLNPPNTPEGRNEWWQHVFAVVYWMNVRNDYRVDDWELGNEPNHPGQGWKGIATEDDYWEFVKLTKDAIDHVYQKYLPGRPYRAYAPVTASTSVNEAGERFGWIKDAFRKVPQYFDAVDYHDFGVDSSDRVREIHEIMNEFGYPDRPLWITEWGPVFRGADTYHKVPYGVEMINTLIRGSWPGDHYVYGSHIVNLYDAPTRAYLIGADGTRRTTYYAMRLGIRALQGGRPTHRSVASNPDLLAITTENVDDGIDLLVTNSSAVSGYDVQADLSELLDRAMGTMWEFSADKHDTAVGHRPVRHGRVTFHVPSTGAVLLRFPRRRW
ncbi:hypothetical protein ACVCAH_25125 [Micromonospora sp. LZ34]